MFLLYAFEVLQEDATNCLALGCLKPDELVALRALKAGLCKLIRPEITAMLSGLGVNPDVIWRPIAKDWKLHNKGDNFGEVLDTGRFLMDKC